MSIFFSNSNPPAPPGYTLVVFQADGTGGISAASINSPEITQVFSGAYRYTASSPITKGQAVALTPPNSSSTIVPCTSALTPIGIAYNAGGVGDDVDVIEFGSTQGTSPVTSTTPFHQGDWFAVNDSAEIYVPSLLAGQSVRVVGMCIDSASSPDVAIILVCPGILYGPYNSTSLVDLTAQSAAISATTIYAVPSTLGGMYKVSWAAKITQASDISSVLGGAGGFQVKYTDADDSVTLTPLAEPSASGTGNTTATQLSGSVIVNAKEGTNIQYQFGYTDTHTVTAMQYSLHIRIEYLG